MEEKKTRSNKKIFVIAAILVLLALILCFGGTTFAKYITEKKMPAQNATAAKWGFVVSANTGDLFSDKYNAGVKATDATVDVQASASAKVVAPGTSGSVTFTIKGSAEVKAKVAISIKDGYTDISLQTGADTTNIYYPVKWTLVKKGTPTDTTLVNKGTLKDLADKLKTLNTDIEVGTSVNDEYTLTWEWVFEDETASKDKEDTLLGYAANGVTTDENAVIKVEATDADKGIYTVTDNSDAKNPVTYTAKTKLSFELSIAVVQVQNEATTPTPET